jgi:zinc/manganese transport system ATP-binding protein
MSPTSRNRLQADPVGPASAIELRDVTMGYNATVIVESLSLSIAAGQFAGVVGPTGSGKTTLLKAILGTQPVYSGEIILFGKSIASLPAGSIGYVPQLESVDWTFPVTVEQVMLMGLYATDRRLIPWASRAEKKKVHDLALRLGIHDCLHHHIVNISGGQQQRAFLGRALISNPRLLILDEPTAGVDIKTQHDVLHLLGELNREGITILLTTHDLNAVASHLPWVICFNQELVAQGAPREVFTEHNLARTYGGDIVIIQQGDHFLIANSTPLKL